MTPPQRLATGHADPLVERLREVVGDEHVLVDPDLTAAYCVDWTGRFHGRARAVVRPASTADVAAVLTTCADVGAPVVVQGGNTGLVGGGVPRGDQMVVLSTRRLRDRGAVDVSTRQVTVDAGVSLAELHRHCSGVGLAYGVDLAARDSATVGGTVATNAGGPRVVLNGDTRRQVRGVEAVLADGSVISHLAGLPKDSAGYDLTQLLVGSEGTLAVVTRVRFGLVEPLPDDRMTVLVGVDDVEAAISLARRQRGLLAAEFVMGAALDLVCDVTGLPFPLQRRWPVYLLLETAVDVRLDDTADAAVDRRLWAYRERQTEAIGTLGVVHKLDVGVPLNRLRAVLDALPDLVAPFAVYVFGHLLEGNLHVEVVGADPDDDQVDASVLGLVTAHGGTVSAEHGVGIAKAAYLGLSRSPAELAAMRAVKRALDPRSLLNPGVILG